MPTRRRLAALTAACLLLGMTAEHAATAGEATIDAPGGLFSVHLTSLRESRFYSVIRQQHDFSCGSAALATLLTYHYDHPVSEETVFNDMFNVGDRAAIERSGFSLADMQRYLASIGYPSEGYNIPLSKVAEAGIPAITLINTKGYNHFVVIKGIKDGDVLVGDPAAGLRAVPIAEFEAMWKGIVFVIRDDITLAQLNFNRPEEWMVRRRAPSGTALDRQGLASFSLVLPGLREF